MAPIPVTLRMIFKVTFAVWNSDVLPPKICVNSPW